ncbi:uncharacterized protein FIBRA_03657 [Fibroporia radiculosa]|uniref:Mediator of RNA polymerase II transcription subunit 17 n=1 Tax=Fibroporia radiculosa TaxID=599839 RepID=J4HW40_9APHY|nr:uncharacterized protein FIBRA_03657 [Fibroporia radiculosa]CCM01597.1 predicted protein [Fibroporia radiculosa]
MEEPPWKRLRLSLERPYKDDAGQPIPALLDITPDGQYVHEPKEDAAAQVGENLRRIFLERGLDFFDKRKHERDMIMEPDVHVEDEGEGNFHEKEEPEGLKQPMTPEELFKMRMEILPQLHIAFGEMSQARDLLSLLLAATMPPEAAPSLALDAQPSSQPQQSTLTATVVTKPPPISSVRAFNAQLVVGGKDRALRQAADLFKFAAEKMESGRLRSETYWVDALRIRRGNWGLVPAPLPLGSATGKGADKTSKDFLISFGMEESPPLFRRRAIARIPTLGIDGNALEFPLRQRTRLHVSVITTGASGSRHSVRNVIKIIDNTSLEGSLRAAQAEVVEQEIFSALIKEASTLPTASARVSERLIVIEADQGTDLQFELIDEGAVLPSPFPGNGSDVCDLIFAALHVLLLRAHALVKAERLRRIGSRTSAPLGIIQPPPILQPVIDMMQYRAFCDRVYSEINRKVQALRQAGVPASLQFEAVGGSGEEFIAHLRENRARPIGGQALIRIDNRHSLRFTFLSPSMLIAHLPQATMGIASIPQLSQLLGDEMGACLLKGICDIGTERCGSVNGTWFVDTLTGRGVGRWEGCVL